MATTPAQVNKAFKKEGIDGIIVKGKGYYYFAEGLLDKVPSIYEKSLNSFTTEDIVNYVKNEISE